MVKLRRLRRRRCVSFAKSTSGVIALCLSLHLARPCTSAPLKDAMRYFYEPTHSDTETEASVQSSRSRSRKGSRAVKGKGKQRAIEQEEEEEPHSVSVTASNK